MSTESHDPNLRHSEEISPDPSNSPPHPDPESDRQTHSQSTKPTPQPYQRHQHHQSITSTVFSPADQSKINSLANSGTILSYKKDDRSRPRGKNGKSAKVNKAQISGPQGLVDCDEHFTSEPTGNSANGGGNGNGTIGSSSGNGGSMYNGYGTSSGSNGGLESEKSKHSVINLLKPFKKNRTASTSSISSTLSQYAPSSRYPSNRAPSSSNSFRQITHKNSNSSISSKLSSSSKYSVASSSASSVTSVSSKYSTFSDMRRSIFNMDQFRRSSASLTRKSILGLNSFSFPSSSSSSNSHSNPNPPNTTSASAMISSSSSSTLSGHNKTKQGQKTNISLPVPVESSREKLKNKLRASSSLLSLTQSEVSGSSVTVAVPVHEHHLLLMEKLYSLVGSQNIVDFQEYIEKVESGGEDGEVGNKLTKLNESVLSQVYVQKIQNQQNKDEKNEKFEKGTKEKESSLVYKIIPFGHEELPTQSPIQDVIQELQIARLMSDLPGFVSVVDVVLVRGRYPPSLLTEWDIYKSNHQNRSNNFNSINNNNQFQNTIIDEYHSQYQYQNASRRPDFFHDSQLYCIIIQNDVGIDLQSKQISSWIDAESVFWQTVIILAQAEQYCQFEHRDLHWGNLVIGDKKNEKGGKSDKVGGKNGKSENGSGGGSQELGIGITNVTNPISNSVNTFAAAFTNSPSPNLGSFPGASSSINNTNNNAYYHSQFQRLYQNPQTRAWLRYIEEARRVVANRSSLRVTLIDYTLSRAYNTSLNNNSNNSNSSSSSFNPTTFHTRMDQPEFFRGRGDYQFDVYRLMRNHVAAAINSAPLDFSNPSTPTHSSFQHNGLSSGASGSSGSSSGKSSAMSRHNRQNTVAVHSPSASWLPSPNIPSITVTKSSHSKSGNARGSSNGSASASRLHLPIASRRIKSLSLSFNESISSTFGNSSSSSQPNSPSESNPSTPTQPTPSATTTPSSSQSTQPAATTTPSSIISTPLTKHPLTKNTSTNSYDHTAIDWSKFCPHTNVLWLHYLLDKLLYFKNLPLISVSSKSGRIYMHPNPRNNNNNNSVGNNHHHERTYSVVGENGVNGGGSKKKNESNNNSDSFVAGAPYTPNTNSNNDNATTSSKNTLSISSPHPAPITSHSHSAPSRRTLVADSHSQNYVLLSAEAKSCKALLKMFTVLDPSNVPSSVPSNSGGGSGNSGGGGSSSRNKRNNSFNLESLQLEGLNINGSSSNGHGNGSNTNGSVNSATGNGANDSSHNNYGSDSKGNKLPVFDYDYYSSSIQTPHPVFISAGDVLRWGIRNKVFPETDIKH